LFALLTEVVVAAAAAATKPTKQQQQQQQIATNPSNISLGPPLVSPTTNWSRSSHGAHLRAVSTWPPSAHPTSPLAVPKNKTLNVECYVQAAREFMCQL